MGRQNTNNRLRDKMEQRIQTKKYDWDVEINFDHLDRERKKRRKNSKKYEKERIPKRKRVNMNKAVPNKKRRKMADNLSSIPSDSSNYSDEDDDCLDIKMVKKPKRLKTTRKKILEKNQADIDGDAMIEMKAICKRLNIGKPPNISCKLYDFSSHLEVYKCIDKLFKNNGMDNFRAFIFKQKQ